ncbi:preprotein translocase subunit YidC [Leptospira ryugenii]|uniref:Membrane protein insertase YidC n=1 Tax=Leptospira ryugenii TaxID=1917863 RepID=A0A2P2E2G6_9LEPT|nr:membrane protein insertase YidC [Leptospira ryugenii]GBF51078.1 preprotein translocase subunit YidC [Leptospira ryugenii]
MQDDTTNRQGRLFLALFISLAIWMGINYLFPPPKPTQPAKKTDQKVVTPEEKTKQEKTKEETPLKTSILNPIKSEDIKTITLHTDSFLVKFSSLGGRITEFYIRNHKEPDGTDFVIAKDPKFEVEFDGKKELAVELSRFKGFDFNLIEDKDAIPFSPYNQVNFTSSYDDATKTVTFSAPSIDGTYLIQKVYRFFPQENYFTFNLYLKNTSKETITIASSTKERYLRSFGSLGPILKNKEDFNDRDVAHYFRYYYLDGSFKDHIDSTSAKGFWDNVGSWFSSTDPNKDERFETKNGSNDLVDFVGTGSRYFIGVLDPLNDKPRGILLDNRKGNETGVLLTYDNWKLAPGEEVKLNFAAYVGVRELDGTAFRNTNLDPKVSKDTPFAGLSESLDKSFNQGITTPLRNGIVWILKKIYLVIPNYGWAIVIFAILFKLAFYPLNKKQAESMKKMQELSPQIKAINEKYADDPKTKQEKTIELYRTNGTNPMSGCLPMLVQIPIFIALYTAFSDTVDLWHSPFLWIKDLSEPDTVFTTPKLALIGAIGINVLPLIMVTTQVIQSKMTTVSTDPNQKMMMYMMPFIMLYFFWSMPAGVTMYWTMQNILSIAQQAYTNRFGKSESKTVTSPAANQSKTSGNANQKGFRNNPKKKKK